MGRYRLHIVDRRVIISWIRVRMLSLHLSRRTWVYRDRIELISLSCAHIRANRLNSRVDVLLKRLVTLILWWWVHESRMNLLLSPKSLSWSLILNPWRAI